MVNGNDGMERAVAARQTQVGGDWFFWIAGFSVVNSLLSAFGAQIHFVIGLGTTELIDGLAHAGGKGFGTTNVIALLLDLVAAGFYALFGFFARRGAKWAFLTGMILYLMDALLLLAFKDWLAVAFHAYALFRIFQGFQAAQRFSRLPVSPPFSAIGTGPQASSDVWPPPPSA